MTSLSSAATLDVAHRMEDWSLYTARPYREKLRKLIAINREHTVSLEWYFEYFDLFCINVQNDLTTAAENTRSSEMNENYEILFH